MLVLTNVATPFPKGISNGKWSTTAEIEEELMSKVAEHAKEEHKDMYVTPDVVAKIKSHIKEI